jgi:hypothetical protein
MTTSRASLFLLIASVVLFPLAGASMGQTPSPTPPPASEFPVACPPNLPPEMPARTLSLSDITVSVPAGRFGILESPQDSGAVVVCHDANAGVRLSSADCSEINRSETSPEEDALLDSIAASCTLGTPPPATPTLAPVVETPTAEVISPPNTGSAGLRDDD